MNENAYLNTKLHQAFHHYIKVVSTNVDLGGRDSVLAYQMVQSSQVMQVNAFISCVVLFVIPYFAV